MYLANQASLHQTSKNSTFRPVWLRPSNKQAARSPATKRAYGSDFRLFAAFGAAMPGLWPCGAIGPHLQKSENLAKFRIRGDTLRISHKRYRNPRGYLFALESACSKAVSRATNNSVPGIVNTRNQGKIVGSFHTPEPSTSNAISAGPVKISNLKNR
jgi:hypothetical protein